MGRTACTESQCLYKGALLQEYVVCPHNSTLGLHRALDSTLGLHRALDHLNIHFQLQCCRPEAAAVFTLHQDLFILSNSLFNYIFVLTH